MFKNWVFKRPWKQHVHNVVSIIAKLIGVVGMAGTTFLAPLNATYAERFGWIMFIAFILAHSIDIMVPCPSSPTPDDKTNDYIVNPPPDYILPNNPLHPLDTPRQ